MAYGQGGAGKTTTINGLLRRSLEDLFAYLATPSGRPLSAAVSVFELYMDAVHDLVAPRSGGAKAAKLTPAGASFDGLVEMPCGSAREAAAVIARALEQRAVGELPLLPGSAYGSRHMNYFPSHVVVQLKVQMPAARSGGTGPRLRGYSSAAIAASAAVPPPAAVLSFFDLAGAHDVRAAG